MDTATAPRSHALRTGRRSQAGQRYLITTVCRDRERRFAEWECASRISSTIDDARLWRDSHPLCWTLMPDHLHVMVELGHTESLASLIRRVKCVTAGVANAIARRHGPVWMPGYHDHALRCDESAIAASRYLVLDPVRAGIVARVGDYPYWNCAWLEPGMWNRG